MTFAQGLTQLIHFFRLDHKSRFVRDSIDSSNMRAAIPVAIYTLITERVMYNRTVLLWNLVPKTVYYAAFVLLALVCIQLLITSTLYLSGRYRNHTAATISSYIFYIGCAVLGQGIAVCSYAVGKQVFLFLPMVAWIFALFLLNPVTGTLIAWMSFEIIPDFASSRIILSNYADRILLMFSVMLLVISIVRWITQLRGAEAQEQLNLLNHKLSDISVHDELTGVKNRHALQFDSEKYIKQNLIVVISDIDDFKYYNDSYGHDTGDMVLRHMADTLSQTFGTESVYRFGGDEFLLVLPAWNEANLNTCIAEWQVRFRSYRRDSVQLHLASTSGYAIGRCETAEDLTRMISLADAMLYEGKLTQKGTINGAEYDPANPSQHESESAEAKLRSGETDVLTGLPNMMYFRSKADLTADILRSAGENPVLAYFNIDHFRRYNRKYGFEAGDLLLKQLAAILSSMFPNALVCRFADDRFTLIAPKKEVESKIKLAAQRFKNIALDEHVNLRAGLYELKNESVNVSLACDCAQQAMSGNGRSVCSWYDDSMREQLELKQYISDHLDEAIEHEWIENLYQPVIRSVNRMVCGMEAFPRWNDPIHGNLEPEFYVPILEESQNIVSHDLYVVRKAVRDYIEYRKRGMEGIPLIINLSYRTLDMDDITAKITELTEGIDPSLVGFDISAVSLRNLSEHVRTTLAELGERGYRIWMDGFGRENSAMDILIHGLIRGIKFDIRMLRVTESKEQIAVFLKYMVRMCKALNISTLALGVEREEEAEFLSEIGCEYMQGFWFCGNLTFEECCSDKFLSSFAVETDDKQAYYSAMSRVDLATPARLDYDSRLETVSNDLPAAIVELRNGTFRTCLSNAAFRAFLKTRGIDSVSQYDALMNHSDYYLHDKLIAMSKEIMRTKRWETMDIGRGDKSCVCSFHVISEDGEDAISIIGVVVNMKLYQTAPK